MSHDFSAVLAAYAIEGAVLLARRGLDRGWAALALMTLLSSLTFVVLEFNGSDAVTVHASYSIVVGLFLLAAALLHRCWRPLAWWIFGLNAGLTVLIWIVFGPGAVLAPVRRLQPLPLAAALAALGLVALLVSGPSDLLAGLRRKPGAGDALERRAATF